MAKWEVAVLDKVQMPEPHMWSLASEKVNQNLNSHPENFPEVLFASGTGVSWINNQARKFLRLTEDNGIKFYRHCRIFDDILAIRPICTKLVDVSFSGLAGQDKLALGVRNALSGIPCGVFIVKGTDTIKDLRYKIVQKLMEIANDVSKNSVIKVINGDKTLSTHFMMKSLVPKQLKKEYDRSCKPPADKKVQTKLQVKIISRSA